MKQSIWVSTSNLLVLVAIILLLVLLFVGNPYSEAWFLKCPLHTMTGWQCPLCGMQRQLHALMHGQIVEAWKLNPFLLFSYPYLVLLLMGQVSPRFRISRVGEWCYHNKVILTFVVMLIGWGVVRNL